MSVSNINEGSRNPFIAPVAPSQKGHARFARLLRSTVSASSPASQSEGSGNPPAPDTGMPPVIQLGVISAATPTVSDILKNSPDYSAKCWDIIFSPVNRGKQYTQMPPGTIVGLRPENNELVWGTELAAATDISNIETMFIGTISEDRPTVSHLFQDHPEFGHEFWNIIHAAVNRNKNYRSLVPGTQVMLNPETRELSFLRASAVMAVAKTEVNETSGQVPISEEKPGASLADAVKQFIGTPYSKIDCYGLLIRGLQNHGIRYSGHGGIRERLEAMAARSGLPINAFFSGEGLVEMAGTKVFSKSLSKVGNTVQKTDEIFSEMAPFLREGYILSFSTPTHGHTGVISRNGDDWTYINSGIIDHEISPVRVSKGVGEELLKAELNNWLVLAANKEEPLTVTVGHVDGTD